MSLSEDVTIHGHSCGNCGGIVGSGSYYSLTAGGEIDKWTCRDCMEALKEQRFFEELVDRLNRNPTLAAKVREALEVKP